MARNLQSQSFTRKKRARKTWTLALLVVIAVSWVCAASFFTRLGAFAVTDIKISGADADIAASLQSAAEQTLAGSYFGLFPRDSVLIYPKAGIVEALKAASPRVEAVSIGHEGLHTLLVSVTEKAPAAVVCAALPDFEGNRFVFDDQGACYLADASGLLFASASSSVGAGEDVYYAPGLSAAGGPLVGSYATSSAEFAALRSFYAGARAIGIEPGAVLIKDGGEYEMYASTTVIYFNDMRPLSDELANLGAFWAHMKGAIFDYVDVRYGANIFYKQVGVPASRS